MKFYKIDKSNGAEWEITEKEYDEAVRKNYFAPEPIIKNTKELGGVITSPFYLYNAIKA